MQMAYALGFTPPAFAHLPQVMGPDGSKLSKRHGATSVFAYRENGYFPEALLNYLARLGWSHGDQEIFSKDELISYFDFDACGKSAGVFNAEKLLWLNFHYMKERPIAAARARGASRSSPSADGAIPGDDAWLEKMIATLHERAKTLVELVDFATFYLKRRDRDRSEGGGEVSQAGNRRTAQARWRRSSKSIEGEVSRGDRAGGVRVGARRDSTSSSGNSRSRCASR